MDDRGPERDHGRAAHVEGAAAAERRAMRVLSYTAREPAGNLMLVQLDDGGFAIWRDDRPVGGCSWPQTDEQEAVARFQAMRDGRA
jgi:hypothetical protein